MIINSKDKNAITKYSLSSYIMYIYNNILVYSLLVISLILLVCSVVLFSLVHHPIPTDSYSPFCKDCFLTFLASSIFLIAIPLLISFSFLGTCHSASVHHSTMFDTSCFTAYKNWNHMDSMNFTNSKLISTIPLILYIYFCNIIANNLRSYDIHNNLLSKGFP